MPKYTQNDMQLAFEDVANGVPVTRAANRNGIPESTLRSRLKGSEPHKLAHEHQQRLSAYQEDQLCNWLVLQDRLGMALTHAEIRKLVISVLVAAGDNLPLGKRWMAGFLRRNDRIKTLRAKPIDSKRLNGANPYAIRSLFDLLSQPGIREIALRNRWNMDETGIFQGVGTNGLVVGQSQRKSTIKKHPGSRHWTTIIEAISATGKCLNLLVIFKGKETQHQWFPEEMDYLTNWAFTSSSKGWTSDDIGLEWLKEVFIPGSKTERPNEKRLLILDGHGSHATPDFMRLCVENRIQLVYLPPHTSHVLQPLDISVFGPLKAAYRAALTLANPLVDTSPTRKEVFMQCYFQARKVALTSSNAKAGWKGAGLWPFNIEKPLGSKFVIDDPGQTIVVQLDGIEVLETNQTLNNVEFRTPSRSIDLQQLVRSQFKVSYNSPTTRRLFRTAGKGLDSLGWQVSQLEAENRALKQEISQSKKRKRATVERDLNKLFVSIANVQATRREVEPVESSESD